MKKISIFVVIVNFKTYDDLSKCLNALESQSDKEKYNYQTIIIDSDYDLKKVNLLKEKYPEHDFILQKRSDGVSTNFNRGFKKAISKGADYIFMVTPDVYLQKDVLKTLVEKMESNKELGAVTVKTLLPTKPRTIYFVGGKIDPIAYSAGHIGYEEVDKGQYDNLKDTQFLNCAVVMMRASAFKRVGFWEPKYYMAYEDADWTVRLKRAGYGIEVDKSVYAIHDESRTVGKKSMRQEYYMARNQLLFIERNAPLLNKILAYLYVLKKSIEMLPRLFKNDKRAHYILLGRKDFIFRRFGYREIKN